MCLVWFNAIEEIVQVKKYRPFAQSPIRFLVRLLEIEVNSIESNLIHLILHLFSFNSSIYFALEDKWRRVKKVKKPFWLDERVKMGMSECKENLLVNTAFPVIWSTSSGSNFQLTSLFSKNDLDHSDQFDSIFQLIFSDWLHFTWKQVSYLNATLDLVSMMT